MAVKFFVDELENTFLVFQEHPLVHIIKHNDYLSTCLFLLNMHKVAIAAQNIKKLKLVN